MPQIIRTQSFVSEAAQLILQQARNAIAERGLFFLALSGGSTPKAIYQELSRLKPDTDRWVITFGDERCVPPGDELSNYRMAREAWLAHTNATVLRMRGEIAPAKAALDYEEQLERFPQLRHDLILLGMGDDGHTASLFPDTTALKETKRRIVENYVDKLGVWRITFTYPFINDARAVVFLVNGAAKQPLVESILRGGTDYPSERVAPTDGELIWMLGE
jgi:6-phosphogluconolactonase